MLTYTTRGAGVYNTYAPTPSPAQVQQYTDNKQQNHNNLNNYVVKERKNSLYAERMLITLVFLEPTTSATNSATNKTQQLTRVKTQPTMIIITANSNSTSNN